MRKENADRAGGGGRRRSWIGDGHPTRPHVEYKLNSSSIARSKGWRLFADTPLKYRSSQRRLCAVEVRPRCCRDVSFKRRLLAGRLRFLAGSPDNKALARKVSGMVSACLNTTIRNEGGSKLGSGVADGMGRTICAGPEAVPSMLDAWAGRGRWPPPRGHAFWPAG